MRKSIIQFCKYLAITSLFLIATTGLIFQSGMPHDMVKKILTKELERNFQQKVTIEKVRGNLITHLKAENIRFYNRPERFEKGVIIHIKKLKAHFSLLKAFQKKGDFAAAADLVEVEKAEVNILRNKKDKWNILFFLPPPKPGQKPQPLTFTGLIKIQDLKINYKDQKGWEAQMLQHPFETIFQHFQGSVNFNNIRNAKLNLTGRDIITNAPINFKGQFDTLNGQYDFKFILLKLDSKKWGPYVFPFKDFTLAKDAPSVEGRIVSKKPFPSDDLPFWYNLTLGFDNASFKMPFFNDPIENLSGKINFLHGFITKQEIQKELNIKTKKQTLLIWNWLLKNNLINKKGRFIKNYRLIHQTIKLKIPKISKSKLNKLHQFLMRPPATLSIQHFNGHIHQTPITGKGAFFLDKGTLDLKIKSNACKIEKIKHLVPALSTWRATGNARSKVYVFGKVDNPHIIGNIRSKKSKLYAFDLNNVNLNFDYFKNILKLEIHKQLYQGNIHTFGSVFLNQKNPHLSLFIDGDALKIEQAFPNFKDQIFGTFNVKTHINGPILNYNINANFQAPSLQAFKQKINSANIQATVKNNQNITINNGYAWINKSNYPCKLDGNIQNLINATVHIKGNNTPLKDIGTKTDTNPGTATFKGVLKATLKDTFWKNPLSELISTMNIELNDISLYNQKYKTGLFHFHFNKHKMNIYAFKLKNNSSDLDIQGQMNHFIPSNIQLKTTHYNLGTSTFIQKIIPNSFKPFSGLLTANIIFKEKNNMSKEQNKIPFPTVSYDGALNLEQAVIQNQPFKNISFSSKWDGKKLSLKNGKITQNQSNIIFNGDITPKKHIQFSLEKGSKINFYDFQILTAPYGAFFGEINAHGTCEGQFPKLNYAINVDGKNIQSNFVKLDKIKGQINYKNSILSLNKVSLQKNNNQYNINGNLNVYPFLKQIKPGLDTLDYEIDLEFKNSKISTFIDIIESINKEFKNRSKSPTLSMPESTAPNKNHQLKGPQSVKISSSKLFDDNYALYHSRSDHTVSGFYNSINNYFLSTEKPQEIGLKQFFSGHINGSFYSKTQKSQLPIIKSNLFLKDAKIAFIEAKNIRIMAFPKKKNTYLDITVQNGHMGAKPFEKLKCKSKIDKHGGLNIHSLDILSEIDSKNIIKGYIPLMALWDKRKSNKKINLDINLNNNDIGVLAVFNKYIDDIKNNGNVLLTINGPIHSPQLSSKKISLNNAKIFLSDQTIFRSPFQISSQKISIINNVIDIPKTKIIWKGVDTRELNTKKDRKNTLVTKGKIDIKNWDFTQLDKLILNMDLAIKKSTLSINLPTFYQGELKISDLTIKGPYAIPISKQAIKKTEEIVKTNKEIGPTIKGNLVLKNGEIYFATGKSATKPSFLLDLSCEIQEGITVFGSIFGNELLSEIANSFELDLGITKTPLLITGSLNALKIQNNIAFQDGIINLFNTNFELLPQEQQKTIFREDPSKVQNNSLAFRTERYPNSEKLRLVPIFNSVAYTYIDPIQSNTDDESAINPEDQKYKHVVAIIDGSIYDLENIHFERYDSDKRDINNNLEFQKSYYIYTSSIDTENSNSQDMQEILEILMPELMANANDTGQSRDQTTRLLSGFGAQGVNLLARKTFIRPLEKQIEKGLGLNDFRIDCNVGGALLSDITGDDENNIGFNMSRYILEDRLMLRVKSALDISAENRRSEDPFQLSEIELTFYIWQNLSLNYTNLKDEENPESFRPKFSLKYSYVF